VCSCRPLLLTSVGYLAVKELDPLAVQIRTDFALVVLESFQEFPVFSLQDFRTLSGLVARQRNFTHLSSRIPSFASDVGIHSHRAKTGVSLVLNEKWQPIVLHSRLWGFLLSFKWELICDFSTVLGQFDGPLSRGVVISTTLCRKNKDTNFSKRPHRYIFLSGRNAKYILQPSSHGCDDSPREDRDSVVRYRVIHDLFNRYAFKVVGAESREAHLLGTFSRAAWQLRGASRGRFASLHALVSH